VKRRRRVSLGESFSIASKTSLNSHPEGGTEFVVFLVIPVFGIWYWLVGMPVNEDDQSSNGEDGSESRSNN